MFPFPYLFRNTIQGIQKRKAELPHSLKGTDQIRKEREGWQWVAFMSMAHGLLFTDGQNAKLVVVTVEK